MLGNKVVIVRGGGRGLGEGENGDCGRGGGKRASTATLPGFSAPAATNLLLFFIILIIVS